MRSSHLKTALKTAALAVTTLLLSAGASFAQSTVSLTATRQATTLPDGNTVPMWGWVCGTGTATARYGNQCCRWRCNLRGYERRRTGCRPRYYRHHCRQREHHLAAAIDHGSGGDGQPDQPDYHLDEQLTGRDIADDCRATGWWSRNSGQRIRAASSFDSEHDDMDNEFFWHLYPTCARGACQVVRTRSRGCRDANLHVDCAEAWNLPDRVGHVPVDPGAHGTLWSRSRHCRANPAVYYSPDCLCSRHSLFGYREFGCYNGPVHDPVRCRCAAPAERN